MIITFSIESSNVWVQNTSTIQVPNVPYENSAVTSRKQGPWPINDGTVFSHVPDHDINTHRARNPGSWMKCSNKTMFSSFQTFRIHQNSVILCWEWTIWIHAVHTYIYISPHVEIMSFTIHYLSPCITIDGKTLPIWHVSARFICSCSLYLYNRLKHVSLYIHTYIIIYIYKQHYVVYIYICICTYM